MEPISIGTIVQPVTVCTKVSGYIYQFARESETVDTSIRVLGVEIDSLSRVLGSLHESFKDPLLANVPFTSQTGHEVQH